MESAVRFERLPSKPGQSGASDATQSARSRREDPSRTLSPLVATSSSNIPLDVTTVVDSAAGPFGLARPASLPASTFFGDASAKLKQAKSKGEPRPGMQDMVPIKNVFDIYRAVSILAGMIANCWSGSNGVAASYRQVMPGLAKVLVGNEVFVCQGFLLQDLEPILIRAKSDSSGPTAVVCDPSVVEVRCRIYTPYFKHILMLLKLRWLLRLHSACCELDYKMCSCSNLLKGLQYVALQQFAEAEADSIFDSKVSQTGSHVNMESVVDDIFDRLHRGLGNGWTGFLEFVSTCDPLRSVHVSAMDSHQPQIVSNIPLVVVVDTVFVTCFLRGDHRETAADLKGCYENIRMLGLPVPELPPLRGAQNLRMWAKAKTKPTRQDRKDANKKGIEKLAQLDSVLLCASMELRMRDILATEEELVDMQVVAALPKNLVGDVVPEVVDFGNTGQSLEEDAAIPPRQILIEKPQLSPGIFDAAVQCVHHHMTFPAGIRERIYHLIVEFYGLTEDQSEILTVAVTQNIDGRRLPTHQLLVMEEREKRRVRHYECTYQTNCSHLLLSPLVSSPEEKKRPAKYTTFPFPTPVLENVTLKMTRSLPELRGRPGSGERDIFRVPLSTGPLTMDPQLNKLRTTGFFIKMPPL